MGCVSVRLSPEETLISRHSVSTGFEKHSTEAVFSAIRERSTARLILSTQFEAIKARLQLNSSEEDKPQIVKMFDMLWKQDKVYRDRLRQVSDRLADSIGPKFSVIEEEQLLILGILLSKGNAQAKAIALFHTFDEGCMGTITANAVRNLIETLFSHAIEVLPALMKQEGNREEVRKYLGKALEHKQRAVSVVASIIVKKTELTLEDFLTEFAEYQDGQFTSPAGLRRFAHSLIHSFPQAPNPPKAKVPKPSVNSDVPALRETT